jgi:hypothetical protein
VMKKKFPNKLFSPWFISNKSNTLSLLSKASPTISQKTMTYPNRQRARYEHAQILAEHARVSMLFYTKSDATTLR